LIRRKFIFSLGASSFLAFASATLSPILNVIEDYSDNKSCLIPYYNYSKYDKIIFSRHASGFGEDRGIKAAKKVIKFVEILDKEKISEINRIRIEVTGPENLSLFDVETATSEVWLECDFADDVDFAAFIDPKYNILDHVSVAIHGLSDPKMTS